MIALLRSTLALTLKEVQHHWLALAFVGFWSALMVPLALTTALAQGGTSFASAAAGLAYYYGPVIVFLVVRRLVVQEYEDGTIRFLDALPAPAWLQLLVKGAVGWVASVGMVWGIALPLLLFAALREYVTVFWFLQLQLAMALYISAWLALTMVVAQLGRFRHWVWLILLVAANAPGLPDHWQRFTWHAAMAETTDATRHLIPWLGFLGSIAWTGGLALVAAFLATFRGGSLPRAAFRNASTRETVSGTALVLGIYLMVEVVPEMGAGTLDGWEAMPAASDRVHRVGSVGDWGEAAEQTLAELDSFTKLDPPSRLVVAAQVGRSWPTGPTVETGLWDRDEVHVRVRGEPTPGGRARLIDAVLEQRSASVLGHLPDRGFAVDGLGLFLVEDEDRDLAELRTALAMRRGLTRSDLLDWRRLRWTHGEDVAAGIGALGLKAAVELGSRNTSGAWVGRHLLALLPESPAATRYHRPVGTLAGVDRDAMLASWWVEINRAHRRRAVEITPISLWQASVELAEEPESHFDLEWHFEGELPSGAIELVAEPIDPIRGRPTPYEPAWRALHLPINMDADIDGRTPTWFASDDRVWAQLRTWEPLIEGWVQSQRLEVGR